MNVDSTRALGGIFATILKEGDYVVIRSILKGGQLQHEVMLAPDFRFTLGMYVLVSNPA